MPVVWLVNSLVVIRIGQVLHSRMATLIIPCNLLSSSVDLGFLVFDKREMAHQELHSLIFLIHVHVGLQVDF